MFVYLLSGGTLCWALWRVLRPYVVASPLDVVPGPPAASALFGNITQVLDKDAWGLQRDITEKYGAVAVLRAPFGSKWLLVSDPVALHRIFTRDQAMYEEPSWFTASNSMFVGDGLLSVTGDVHRKQRKILTPVFSVKYLKEITPIFSQVTNHLVDALASRASADPGTEVEIVGWMGRTALELIGQAGLGCSIDPLTDAVPDPLATAAKEFSSLAFSTETLAIRQAIPFLRRLGPPQFRRWLVDRIPIQNVRRLKTSIDTMYGRSSEIVAESKRRVERARAEGDESEITKNLISVLLHANMDAEEEDRMSDEQVVGQMTTLLFAAMDTTSNALSRTLHLLSLNPQAQAKLRREVLDATTNGLNVSYDDLHNLPYLDAICRETLRLYPPIPLVFRDAITDTVLPLSTSMRGCDGSSFEQVHVPAGTTIVVSNIGTNTNPEIWGADAYEWRPERWLEPLPKTLEDAPIPGVYSHLMTFIGGSRSCIGFKFSQLEMKVVLCALIANFEFELSDKPVFWNLTGVVYPSLGKDSLRPEMWLRLRQIRPNAA